MKLSDHFSDNEWTCNCGCGQMLVNPDLLELMESIRTFLGSPIDVHCVNRCKEHNKVVGGVNNSQHLKGNACDFHATKLSMGRLHDGMIRMHEDGLIDNLGLYDWGCHVDTRFSKHFWDNR